MNDKQKMYIADWLTQLAFQTYRRDMSSKEYAATRTRIVDNLRSMD